MILNNIKYNIKHYIIYNYMKSNQELALLYYNAYFDCMKIHDRKIEYCNYYYDRYLKYLHKVCSPCNQNNNET
jgi:hypothetical protein